MVRSGVHNNQNQICIDKNVRCDGELKSAYLVVILGRV